MTLLCACLHIHWFCKIPLGMSRHTFGSSPCEYRVYVYIILSSCRTPTPLINPQCTLIQSLVRTSSLSHHYWILLHVTTSCTVHHVLLVFTIWFCWFLSSAGRLMGTSYGCSREESVLWGRLVVLIRMSWAKMETGSLDKDELKDGEEGGKKTLPPAGNKYGCLCGCVSQLARDQTVLWNLWPVTLQWGVPRLQSSSRAVQAPPCQCVSLRVLWVRVCVWPM